MIGIEAARELKPLGMPDDCASFPTAAAYALGVLGHDLSPQWVSNRIGRQAGCPARVDQQWVLERMLLESDHAVQRADPGGLMHGTFTGSYADHVQQVSEAGHQPAGPRLFRELRAAYALRAIEVESHGHHRDSLLSVEHTLETALAREWVVIAAARRSEGDNLADAIVLHRVTKPGERRVWEFDPVNGTILTGLHMSEVTKRVAPSFGYLAFGRVQGNRRRLSETGVL